ncbi:hypothetical protein MMC11_004538 [Xylographa trunciseda]|nr:hypothetical protein [Xylographa trunciseda]
MAIVIDLEDQSDSSSSSPRSSKKRRHDGTIIEECTTSTTTITTSKDKRENSRQDLPIGKTLAKNASAEIDSASYDLAVDESVESASGEGDVENVSYQEPLGDEEIKGLLLDALDNIDDHSAGTYAAIGTLTNPVNPGLSIEGLGGIGLPLTANDAHRIIAICHQAPFGKGCETIVDTAVRKTWELNPAQFLLRNPAWSAMMKDIVINAAADLGVEANSLHADLYKLLLYEEGAFFQRHTDTEKAHGMLGTLVIALPSPHTGGAVEVVFGNERRLLETAPNSDFGLSWLAWYADVEHAVQRVASGHRLVLTYNLINRATGESRCAASLGKDKQMIADALLEWSSAHQQNWRYWPLAYMLEHKYTEANLRFDHLKGNDRVRAHCLQDACREQGFSLFIANLEQTIIGACEENYRSHYYDDSSEEEDAHHYIDEELERSLQLRTVALPDGVVFANNIDFEEDNILQEEPFGDLPDDEDYEGYTGNAGASTTHYYRETCLLVMPEDTRDDIFFISKLSDTQEIQRILKSLLIEVRDVKSTKLRDFSQVSPQQCQRRLERFCKIIVEGTHYFGSSVCENVIEAALLLDQPLLLTALANTGSAGMPSSFYLKIGQALPFEVSESSRWLAAAACLARKSKGIQEIWSVLCGIASGVELSLRYASKRANITLDALYTWVYSVLVNRVTVSGALESKDICLLVKISYAHQHGEKFLLGTVVPYIKRDVFKKKFVVVFLGAVYDAYKEEHIHKELVTDLHRDLLNFLGPELFKLDNSTSSSKRSKYSTPYGYGARQPDPSLSNCPKPKDFVGLLEQCLSLELDEYYQVILQEFVQKSESIPLAAFGSIWIPILRQFLMMINNRLHEDNHRDDYRRIFSTVLNNYIFRFLGVEPPKSTMSTPLARGCGCTECRRVDLFLLDPAQEIGRFALRKSIRDHLERQFGRFHKCTTDHSGSPHTLVIAKNEAEYKAKRGAASYEERVVEARTLISSIGLPALNRLLGTTGNELVEFNSVRNKLIAAGHRRAPLAGIFQPAIVPTSHQAPSMPKASDNTAKTAIEID